MSALRLAFSDFFRSAVARAAGHAHCRVGAKDRETNLRLAVIATTRYLEDLACLPGDPPEEEGDEPGTAVPPATPVVVDPRAGQKAAQTACIATLAAGEHRTNCTNVKRYCPDVEPILRGEPLYGSLRDSDNDGIVCESL